MISYYTVATILICHFIFDFFFQTDEMAKGKSRNNTTLFEHSFVVTLGILLMGILNYQYFGHAGLVAAFIIVNGVAHFFTDYFSSRASSRLWADNEYHDFFGTIGLDQLVHYITLFGTFAWLTSIK